MPELLIAEPGKTRMIEFNGNPDDRALVEEEFTKLLKSGLYLAYAVVVDEKTKKTTNEMTREFFPGEVETMVLAPRLVGG